MYELVNQTARRTIHLKLSGFVSLKEMRTVASAYRMATASYGGTPHFVLLDFRAASPLEADAAEVLEAALAYGRLRGVALCVRVGGSAGLGADYQGVTVQCRSLPEAQRLLVQARGELHVPVACAA